MDVNELLNKVLAELESMVSTKRVVGEPINFQGVTILPVMKVGVGYGGGGGTGEGKDGKTQSGGSGKGGGAGAGLSMEPTALIVIQKDEVNVYPIKGKGGIASAIEALAEKAPDLIEKGIELKAKQEKIEKEKE